MKLTPENISDRLYNLLPANEDVKITVTSNKKKELNYYINENRVFFVRNYLANLFKNIFVKRNNKNCMSISFDVTKKLNK